MDWLDISVPIRDGMMTFEGDPAVHLERAQSMADGAICNVSRLDFGLHSGTHIDAPIHFIDGAAGIETVDLDALIGPVFVVDATGLDGSFDRAAIDRLAIPPETERLLFRSRNTALWDKPGFDTSFVAVTGDGAAALVERGLRLVGADYLSIAPFDEPIPTHQTLLRAGIVIVEGLDLRTIEPGWYDLICLPLLIPGSDGGPARAIVRPRAG
jgi:arylformamidase